MSKILLIRFLGDKYLKYHDPIIIEQTDSQIVFIDSESGKEITLPTNQYQLEKRGEKQ